MKVHIGSIEKNSVPALALRHASGAVIDLTALTSNRPDLWPAPLSNMIEVIAGGESLLAAIRATVQAAGDAAPTLDEAEMSWLPPVPRPGKILGIALNNSASDARRISGPAHPMFFMKPATALLGHRQPLVVRSYYGGVHPEPELAVIIGKTAQHVAPQVALDHVFGYSVLNDITGNDMRAQDMVHYYALYASAEDPDVLERREQHLSYAARYKGSDGFCPIGPWIATRDEIPDPGALSVRCSVGEDIVAEDSTRYLTYSVAEVIAFISRFHTLEPGDIISMGTAFRPGEGQKRTIHTADLQRLDGPVSVTIQGIGTLSNPVQHVTQELGDWRLPR